MMTVSPGAEAAMPDPQKREDSALAPKLAAPQHNPPPFPLFLELLRSETAAKQDRIATALQGLRQYQDAPRQPLLATLPTIHPLHAAPLRVHRRRPTTAPSPPPL